MIRSQAHRDRQSALNRHQRLMLEHVATYEPDHRQHRRRRLMRLYARLAFVAIMVLAALALAMHQLWEFYIFD